MSISSPCKKPTNSEVEQELEQTITQALQQAEQYHLSGEFQAAEELYRGIIEIQPNHPEANHNLGVLLEESQAPGAGLQRLLMALKARPDREHYWVSYIGGAIQAGQLETARQMLELGRQNGLEGAVVENLENLIKGQLEPVAPVSVCVNPTGTENLAGNVIPLTSKEHGPSSQDINKLKHLVQKGDKAGVEAFSRNLTRRFPGHGLGWKVLGQMLREQGRVDEALQAMLKAVELLPEDPAVHNDLGIVLQDKALIPEAEKCYCRALELQPEFVSALTNLGNIYRRQGWLQKSEKCHRRALKIETKAIIFSNLGATLMDQKHIIEGETCYRQALELDPGNGQVHMNLGISLRYQGRLEEAIASQRRGLECDPDCLEVLSNLLFTLNYSSARAEESYLKEALKYGDLVKSRAKTPFSEWLCNPRPTRLRIGFVSGDMHNHPVGFFLESLLRHFNRDRVELIAYPTNPDADDLTARIKPRFDAWKPLFGLNDENAAHLIHGDGVHVLLDLSGHTSHNRLPMFAWKPAPVQVSWLGYFATTGVAAIDYFLADEVGVTPSQKNHFTETLWYLPGTRLCFSAPGFDLSVSNLPAKKNGHVTFGCFQNLTKVGDKVLKLWSEIFGELPSARLRWQCRQFNDPAVVEQVCERFRCVGIDLERVTIKPSMSRKDYLAAHAEVDMILDTFPFPGGTTTCEALWMGVPTLTLAGETLISRQGASLLTAAGLEDWISSSESEYIAKAVARAKDQGNLQSLRSGLRAKVLDSPLFNATSFTRNLETAFWEMWKEKEPYRKFVVSEEFRERKAVPSGNPGMLKTFLHVGCGSQRKDTTTKGFDTVQWEELRLDINEAVKPDIVGTMTDMSQVEDASVDAIFSKHNIEHLYPHEVPLALEEFIRVLKEDGFVVITCPDLQAVCALVAQDKLDDPAYISPAGPIAPLDILYGHRGYMAQGNIYMAHRCGFTETVLKKTLQEAGFASVLTVARPASFDLWALASKCFRSEEDLQALAAEHFSQPVKKS